MLALRILIAGQFQYLHSELELACENAFKVFRGLIDDDECGKRCLKDESFKKMIKVSGTMRRGIALTLLERFRLLLESLVKDILNSSWLSFERKRICDLRLDWSCLVLLRFEPKL